MFPMERSRIYKILAEIFNHHNSKPTTNLCGITMKEASSHTSDIDFWCYENTTLIGYLRIVNPPENCVDGEYCIIYHSSLSHKDANIGIGPTGATRVYGEEIQNSFIYRTLCANKNKFGEYAKELTCAEQKLVFDKVVCVVNTFCEKLMNEHASTFDQLDMTVDRDDCKFFYVRSLNSPGFNLQFDVVSHIDTISIPHNEVWVRFSVASGNLWTPITINPYKRQIVIHSEVEQPVFTGDFNEKQLVNLATKIREATGFVVCCNEGASDKSQSRSIYIRRMLEESDELRRLKESIIKINSAIAINEMKDKTDGCDEVFQVVVDWLHAISSCDRIKDVKNINHLDHTLDVSNSVGCGASKQYVTEKLKVSYTPYMKTIMISLGNEHIITIDYLGLGDKSTCVYIVKYNQKGIDDVLNKYLVACLAEVLKDRLGIDKLRAYTTAKCTQYTELTHCGPCFFNDDGKTAYAIDPNNVISNETINKNNKTNTILDMKAFTDDLIDKKLEKFVKSGSLVYTTRDYLYSQICDQLTLWQQEVFHEIYSAIFCTLAESKCVGSAFELERRFMELVATDKDGEGFHVYFRLNNINQDLPKFDIAFFDKDNTYIRMQENEWTKPCALIKRGDEIKVYKTSIKYMKGSYKTIVSHVVSKIVLLEGLS